MLPCYALKPVSYRWYCFPAEFWHLAFHRLPMQWKRQSCCDYHYGSTGPCHPVLILIVAAAKSCLHNNSPFGKIGHGFVVRQPFHGQARCFTSSALGKITSQLRRPRLCQKPFCFNSFTRKTSSSCVLSRVLCTANLKYNLRAKTTPHNPKSCRLVS